MNQIESVLQAGMSELKSMIDVDTVVGAPVQASGGTTVIPVCRVSFGIVSGGGEYQGKRHSAERPQPFAGGVGTGVSITPVAFLVAGEGDRVQLLSASPAGPLEKLVDNGPGIVAEVKKLLSGGKSVEESV